MKVFYLIAAVVAVVVALFAYKNSRFGVASPEYRVIESDGPFEIRDYPSMVVVETPMASPDINADDSSFMRLFGYISGSNEAEQAISMTTPVMTTQDDGGRSMSFIVPSNIAEEGAPRPTSSEVALEVVPGGRFAAYRFSGSWSEERFEDAARKLEAWLHQRDVEFSDNVIIANYDPPFMPSLLRRNEVWVRLSP